MYFTNFPDIYYQFTQGGKETLKVVKDITLNIRPIKELVDNILLYDEYIIQGSETPEVIAEKVYGNPLLHWTIMLVNEKYDYINDYPMDEGKLSDFVTNKYGAGNEYHIHQLFGRDHYEDADGHVVDSSNPLSTPVTNYDYEFRENEAKRKIKIVSPKYISIFVKDITEAFQTNV